MEFVNEFTLDAPPDDVFALLSDVERVAPCLPGAQLHGREGDAYRGSMRVKVGPVTAEYHGTLEFAELDPALRHAVLQARASETGGQGGAEARIAAAVVAAGAGSRVTMQTELEVRGRVAQFGSAPMEKISKRMFAEFARNLERTLPGGTATADGPAGPAGGTQPPEPPPAQGADGEAPALNLFALVGGHAAERVGRWALPATIGLAVGFVFGRVV
jgi:carbon monoxide dehydrogenase subunit G